MMKEYALHRFFSRWGIKAYYEGSVPENAELPYITYSFETSNIGRPVFMSASLWYSGSWTAITEKSNEISCDLGVGGITVPYDNGFLWVVRGSPFAQRVPDENPTIRRIRLNFNVEFMSEV